MSYRSSICINFSPVFVILIRLFMPRWKLESCNLTLCPLIIHSIVLQ